MRILFLFPLFLIWSSGACEPNPLADELDLLIDTSNYLCDNSFYWNRQAHLRTFRKPLYIGASITGNLGTKVPAYNTLVAYYFGEIPENMAKDSDSFWLRRLGIRPEWMGSNPGKLVSSKYRGHGQERKLARTGRADVERSIDLSKAVTVKTEDLGSLQVASLLNEEGENRQHYENSSIIYGIDLFYWDAVRNLCGHGHQRVLRKTNERVDTEYQIRRLISRTREDGKPLVLGTVPYDQLEKVLLIPEKTGWRPPQPECVKSINDTIRSECKPENECYTVDLEKMVKDLYDGEKLTLNNGESFDLYQLRPDGVHLSRSGSRYVAEEIQRQIESNPPVACPNN